MENNLAPIILFVYNRPYQTRKTLESLAKNLLADQSTLFIYADGPKNNSDLENRKKIDEVLEIIHEKKWCGNVNIKISEKNNGLANSVIMGVSEIINQFGKVIVLEDDLETSQGFLEFMNNALNRYSNKEEIMHVSGFQFPIGLVTEGKAIVSPIIASWGWATWKRAWAHFDPSASGYEILKSDIKMRARFDIDNTYIYSNMLIDQMDHKTIDSWAIRWYWSYFKNGGKSIFPDCSLVKNIGYGKSATHTKGYNPFPIKNFRSDYRISSLPESLELNEDAVAKLKKMYINLASKNQGILSKIRIKVKNRLTGLFSR